MRSLKLGAAAATFLLLGWVASVTARHQAEQTSVFTVVVDGPARAVRCQYAASFRPPGVFDWGRVSPAPGTISIRAAPYEGQAFEALTAFIYCPGFNMSLLDVPSVTAVGRRATVSPTPANMTRVTGTVAFPDGERKPHTFEIEVAHWAYWIVEHYGNWDGVIPQFVGVATTRLSPDGSFVVDLPNLSRDPLCSRFRERGGFSFAGWARDPGRRPERFELQTINPAPSELEHWVAAMPDCATCDPELESRPRTGIGRKQYVPLADRPHVSLSFRAIARR